VPVEEPSTAQAVLFRASHHSAQLEIELSRRNIPFKVQDQVEGKSGKPDILSSIEVPTAAAEAWPTFADLIARLRKAKVVRADPA
jgi:hypothetical protein